MINRDGKPDAYCNNKGAGRGKPQVDLGYFWQNKLRYRRYRTLKGSANPTNEKVSPMGSNDIPISQKEKKELFESLGLRYRKSFSFEPSQCELDNYRIGL